MLPPAWVVCNPTQALLPAVAAVHRCPVLQNLLVGFPVGLPSSGTLHSGPAVSRGIFPALRWLITLLRKLTSQLPGVY